MSPAPQIEMLANELLTSVRVRCRQMGLPLTQVPRLIDESHYPDEVKAHSKLEHESYYARRLQYGNHFAMVEEGFEQQIDVHDRDGAAWSRLVANIRRNNGALWDDDRIDRLWSEAKSVTDLMPNPSYHEDARGLVMGYVQSGKTANFTAVIAQAVDVGYELIIVLTGGSKSLRAQTHARLWGDLENKLHGPVSLWSFLPDVPEIGTYEAWPALCANDIRRGERADVLRTKPVVIVAKKNATVLKELNNLIVRARGRTVANQAILVIDDEADQASPTSSKSDIKTATTINARIRTLLGTCAPSTYVGYTATPYANVFIDREDEGDLFPRTFIKPIKHGDGYFGAREFFGSEDAEMTAMADFVHIIDAGTVNDLSPPASRNIGAWTPQWNDTIQDAVLWFLMATAARRSRDGEARHSSMLVHTGFNIASHRLLQVLLENRIDGLVGELPEIALRTLYEDELAAVPPEQFAYEPVPFDDMRSHLDDVVGACRVIMDNSESSERLDYSSREPQVVIAVGGNTLSRGLTLEGLVCSLFVRRSTKAYDTLMQMGRWFGYRPGYEDLPRLWTTADLMSMFRKVADIENDLRETIEQGVSDGLTPSEMQIEIVQHPGMTITSKMGAAKLQVGLESLGTGQPSYPKAFKSTEVALRANLAALRTLVENASVPAVEAVDGRCLLGVATPFIAKFLDEFAYADDDDLGRFSAERPRRYLSESEGTEGPLSWNVVLVKNQNGDQNWGVDVGLGKPIIPVERGQEPQPRLGVTRFQGILSKTHMLIDLGDERPDSPPANWIKAAELRRERLGESTGLLLIYLIHRQSKTKSRRKRERSLIDLDLPEHIVAPVIVFPYRPRATRKLVAEQ